MKRIWIVLVLVAGVVACQSAQEKAKEQIKNAEKTLIDKNTKYLNAESAVMLVKAYLAYVEEYPEDTLCAGYLFKAADISGGLRLPQQSIELYKRCYGEYPDYYRAPQAMFLHAFTLENQLSDYFHANRQYEAFIKRYPKHPLVKDATYLMENMGKTDEEVVKSFEEKSNK